MADKPKTFANGLIFKRNDKAPEYVIGNLSVAVESFGTFTFDPKLGAKNKNTNESPF